jgi:predicted Rossmann fold flavoprotein
MEGSLLWTHFGVSGPVVLDASRHWLRQQLEGNNPEIRANVVGDSFEAADAHWVSMTASRPRQTVGSAVASLVPAAVAGAACAASGVAPTRILAELPRDVRRGLIHTLTDWHLPVRGSRGYNYAEVTAGGVNLSEVNPATMESRITPGFHLVGEVVDVDGRLGGFNFQWAWSSAFAAAQGIARAFV